MAEEPPIPEFDFPDRDDPPPRASAAEPAAEAPSEPRVVAAEPETGFLSPEPARRHLESVLVRLVATAGIVGIGTAVAAVMGTFDVAVWLIGLVVALLSVVLAALLWRSRVL
jgi:hypothetical protein